MSRKSYLKTATIICLLCLLLGSTQSKPESQWTLQMTAEFRARSQQAITLFAGSHYGSTAFENEKRSYPRAMMDFLAGNREKAIVISTTKYDWEILMSMPKFNNNKLIARFQDFRQKIYNCFESCSCCGSQT